MNLFDSEDFLKGCPGYDYNHTFLPAVPRVIAIGDIHGDLGVAIESFRLAKLIDQDLNWIADPPNTIVVQVGDQIDSCRPLPKNNYDCHSNLYPGDLAEDLKVIEFFDRMDSKAKEKGGRVYSLIGNHELMNVMGDMRYVSHANNQQFHYVHEDQVYQGPEGRKEAFKPGGPLAHHLSCTRLSLIVIGSNIFIHAGILPSLIKYMSSYQLNDRTKLMYINMIVRRWLQDRVEPELKSLADKLVSHPDISPFWCRFFGKINEDALMEDSYCKNFVEPVLKVLDLNHMIVGHTPQIMGRNQAHAEGITKTCDSSVYRIDVGLSRAFNVVKTSGLIEVLEIINDNEFKILSNRDQ